ncbi:protein of unknown function [Candidatus Nitrosacidococcus tergens]|uniref:Uncharacterized protein n=1 Tax=Candidatus Nitrosacidococcus tergens TaxID=553981 RepID=A0A7G1QC57_9GAMM|nr:protein of unknown function [Candidatus Nitrosacidococcus tergens]
MPSNVAFSLLNLRCIVRGCRNNDSATADLLPPVALRVQSKARRTRSAIDKLGSP